MFKGDAKILLAPIPTRRIEIYAILTQKTMKNK